LCRKKKRTATTVQVMHFEQTYKNALVMNAEIFKTRKFFSGITWSITKVNA
ncbi:unnamed protein product, partial [Prunus brigantina]